MQARKTAATASRQDSHSAADHLRPYVSISRTSGAGYGLPCLSIAAVIPAGTGCNIPITRAGTVAPVLHAVPIAPAADHAARAGARWDVLRQKEPLKGTLKLLSKFFD